ncbi:MAG: polysaccharide biosynthesis protein, partial [Thermoplasmata archaeon]|nr:polysaccharide biosynthesis protein [Thermoplasmata archaeon]
ILMHGEHVSLYPRSVILISLALSIVFLGGIRGLFRIFSEKKKGFMLDSRNNNKKNLLIIGAGDAGITILKEINRHRELNYRIIGFLDDDMAKIGMYIHNVKVLGEISKLPRITDKYKIDEIIIAIPSAKPSLIKKVVDLTKGKVKLKILPGLYELINGKVSISRVRPLKLEDFLGREPVKINLEEVKGFIKEKKVLITGAAGSIGSELSRQIDGLNPEKLILLDIKESELYMLYHELKGKREIILGDIRDKEKMEEIFKKYKPDIVFHSAAYKHVPLMEDFPEEAVKTNVFGTLNLVEISDRFGVESFVFISTDKAVNPTSIMGLTKRIGEIIVQEFSKRSKTKFIIVRFGNVLGSNGSVIPLFKKQIEMGGPVTVTHPDMERYFMTIPEAVQLILQASSMGKGGEIFILDMGKPVKILDIAKSLIKIYGYEPDKDIKIVFTGIRPGEKLKEELWDDKENVKKSKHPKIFLVKEKNSKDKMEDVLNKLEKLIKSKCIKEDIYYILQYLN